MAAKMLSRWQPTRNSNKKAKPNQTLRNGNLTDLLARSWDLRDYCSRGPQMWREKQQNSKKRETKVVTGSNYAAYSSGKQMRSGTVGCCSPARLFERTAPVVLAPPPLWGAARLLACSREQRRLCWLLPHYLYASLILAARISCGEATHDEKMRNSRIWKRVRKFSPSFHSFLTHVSIFFYECMKAFLLVAKYAIRVLSEQMYNRSLILFKKSIITNLM